jgi:hypothetical protein
LGCGYGYNLNLLGAPAYGGESSTNAIQIGRRLNQDIQGFDYYDRSDYEFVRPDSTILTVHSIEQLPSAADFLSNVSCIRSRVMQVIHIEPCSLPERNTLLGMIRNRYNELIDHNHDLVKLLRERADVEIVHFEPDYFGVHPLNSSHILVWRFR